jgi:hypothetical protein
MDIEILFKQSPQHIQESSFVQAMVQLIQSQTEQIQSQTEQIDVLKKTIESLKDDISRLNKTPKRPKFKPNKMEPRNRKNKSFKENCSKNINFCIPDKKQEEIKVIAENVPKESRFKGYSNFKIQDLIS